MTAQQPKPRPAPGVCSTPSSNQTTAPKPEHWIVKLWETIENERSRKREQLRLATLIALKTALAELLPGQRCVVFGSLLRPGRFHAKSDVDLALLAEPRGCSEYRLQALLEERMHRPVDLLLLPESRLREKILGQGELWTNSD